MSSGYDLLKTLFQHSRTTVYLAQYRTKFGGQRVVLKKTDLKGAQMTTRRLALQEGQVLSRLKHPNVIKCLDCFEEEEAVYLVMEWAELGDLSSAWRGGTYQEVMDVLIQMLLALRYLHGAGLIHRDVKTKNILCSSLIPSRACSLRVKLGDFGIARITSRTGGMAQTCIGTPMYSSPEIFAGAEYDTKVDIWSLGCVVYELVSGRRPFESDQFRELSHKVRHCAYPALSKEIPFGLRDLVDSMLQAETRLRPTADELLAHPYVKEHCNRLYKELTSTPPINDPAFRSRFKQLQSRLGTRGAAQSIVSLMAPELEAELASARSGEQTVAIAYKAWKRMNGSVGRTSSTLGDDDLTMTIHQHI